MIQGQATDTHTESWSKQFPQHTFTSLGGTGYWVSQAGFGCYRVSQREPIYAPTLKRAILGGVNVIDTSSNYALGRSEQMVGEVLGELISEGKIKRENIVVVTKGGYLQGPNYALSQERKQSGNPFPELVEYDDNLEHCIHPEFLDDQITRSLQRLNCETVDVYLLHNPEYYLLWAATHHVDRETAEAEYYRRIEVAFEHLEKEVARGRIACYGISSNTFPLHSDQPGFCSLSRIWEMAQKGKPHFKVIQYPMNLLERGAAINANQTDGKSLLEYCHSQGIGTLVNRPLNAIWQGRLFRLAEPHTFMNDQHPQYKLMEKNIASIRNVLAKSEPDWAEEGTLSQLAVRTLRSSQGNNCVLVGMRRPSYVKDILEELGRDVTIKPREIAWNKLVFAQPTGQKPKSET